MKKMLNRIGILGIMMLLIAGCSELNNENYGTLKISITDAPFPIDFIDSANVTITKLEARVKGDSSGSEFITLYEEIQSFNLLELRNGVTANMAELEVPVGDIDLIRIYVEEASLTLTNGDSYSVKVPSGAQTGIKIFIDPAIRVNGGLTSEVLLDFNVDKSFVLKGNIDTPAGIKGFNFKPVIRAVNNTTAGMVEGIVMDADSVIIADASVWIAKDTTITTAYTNVDGYYGIPGIPAGTYSLSAVKEGYDTVTVSEIEIIEGNLAVQDFLLVPIVE